MSHPTVLGPWFVVQRLRYNDHDGVAGMEYYMSMDQSSDSKTCWSVVPRDALLFMSLASAARVAAAMEAEVRVLTSADDAKPFDRG